MKLPNCPPDLERRIRAMSRPEITVEMVLEELRALLTKHTRVPSRADRERHAMAVCRQRGVSYEPRYADLLKIRPPKRRALTAEERASRKEVKDLARKLALPKLKYPRASRKQANVVPFRRSERDTHGEK